MAVKAKSKQEEIEEIKQPDFKLAAKILRLDVRPAEESNAKSRGELSAAWKAIENDAHVNKKAAKLVHWMRTASGELKDDFLRSLYGLMKEMSLGISPDLVDRAGGASVPEMPVADKRELGAAELAALDT